MATYEDIEVAKMNYINADSGVVIQASDPTSGLSKQQKIALARGASPAGAGSPARASFVARASENNAAANLRAMGIGQGGII